MLCVASAALASSRPANASSDSGPVRILAYEPFKPIADATTLQKTNTGSVRRLKFDAYGRRFALTLEKNARLAAATLGESDPNDSALSLYQGTVENIPGSWVRLSARAQAIRGMIWDGRELYIVDSAEVLGDSAAAAADATIIFRLADTQIEAGASFCGSDGTVSARSGKAAYESLVNELKNSPVIMQAAGASARLEISALGDSLFRARYSTQQQARDAILTRLNNVDGIFSSQLGVEIQVPTLNLADSVANTLSATTVPNDLLVELSTLRNNIPTLNARGLTHLFTGRNLNGSTVGIAYTDALCSKRYGAGLTEASSSGAGIDALIAAHEIGHNFGATHDGEGQCASTPQMEYVMSPRVGEGSSTFSQCSLNAMLPRMQNASCILPLAAADLSVPTDLGTQTLAVSRPFDWELPITNVGGSTAISARAILLVPPVVTVDDASVAGGTCVSGAGVISCEMGNIPAAGSRVILMTLRSDVVGSNSISARVSAQNDAQAGNNTGDGTLAIEPEADLEVALQAPASAETGSAITVSFTTRNLALIDAPDVSVEITLPSGFSATSATVADGICAREASTVRCTLTSLAANATATGTIAITASAAGAATVRARVSGSYVDPNTANDTAEKSISVVQPSAANSPGASKRGGGGSSGILFLLGLSALLWVRPPRSLKLARRAFNFPLDSPI